MEVSWNFCCICIEEKHDFESVNESDENGLRYWEKLAVCDSKQIWEDKALILCRSCIEKLNIVYDFLEQCKKSELLRTEKLKELEQKRANNGETFTCYICKKSFKKKRFVKSHITRMHVNIKPSKPRFNGRTDKKENTQTTDSNISNDFKTENDSCDDYLSNDNALAYSSEDEDKPNHKPQKQQKKRQKQPESFTCEYCGKQFKRQQHWAAHIRSIHTFEKPYKCTQCEACFTTSHSLLIHKRNHNNEKPYICSTCGKGFVCSGDLFHHNKIHLNKKEFECNFCSKRFNTTSILRTHKIVKHTEPQNWKYACMICLRRFPISSSLNLHMKRHSGIKDHPCHICDKKFLNKFEVAKHLLSHSNHKSFKCNLCEDKEYKCREGLNKHMKKIHDLGNWKPPKMEKKFLCSLCPKKFYFNNKLKRHMVTHTGEKPYKCDFCDKKFGDAYYVRVHMKKEHELIKNEEEKDEKFLIGEPGVAAASNEFKPCTN